MGREGLWLHLRVLQAGGDPPKGRWAQTHASQGSIAALGGLCDMAALKMQDPVMVSSTNGVGTKLKIASTMQRFDTVGHDVVALCANDVASRGAEPVFMMDHYAAPKLDAQHSKAIATGQALGF